MDNRNGYMLSGALSRRGYDWWWHSLVGINEQTGIKRPFFIEYYVVNPALGGDNPIPGQLAENRTNGVKPAYAMLKAGAWGKRDSVQIHNFYPISQFKANPDYMDVQIGPHTASETQLRGEVHLSKEDAVLHPEYMSDPGDMIWDLHAEKLLSYSVGYGTSQVFRQLNAFQMYWHVAGMRTKYEGSIQLNGNTFRVTPESCAGYQDKNWGSDYTSPWVWLSCNQFSSRTTGKSLPLTSLDVGGAQPVVFGKSLPRRLLIAFYHEGNLYEFNFSKFWTGTHQEFNCKVGSESIEWHVLAWNRTAKIEINFSCPRDTMLMVNYENPDGQKRHNQLWNGGYAQGTVSLYHKENGQYRKVDDFDGEMGGCEYGEYDR